MTKNSSTAILNALRLLDKKENVDTVRLAGSVPTAQTRSMLTLLAGCKDFSDLEKQNVDVRKIADALNGWDGKTRTTKIVVRAIAHVLSVPGKYGQAVEMLGFYAAFAPLVEPDRAARIIEKAVVTDTSFSPDMYTLQFSQQLKKAFERYPEQRREQLLSTLWDQSHKGRWWDITAGTDERDLEENNIVPEEYQEMTTPQLVDAYVKRELNWYQGLIGRISQVGEDEDILDMLKDFKDDFNEGAVVNPDIAVYASYFDWLSPVDKPESPICSLVRVLNETMTLTEDDNDEVRKALEWKKQPKKFSDLFPNVAIIKANDFPFNLEFLRLNNKVLGRHGEYRLEIVRNPAELAANRTYMGNCTWSYKSRMEKGEYVLFRIHHDDNIYNGAFTLSSRGWTMGEINSRYNRGQVPTNLRTLFSELPKNFPATSHVKEINNMKKRVNRLTVSSAYGS